MYIPVKERSLVEDLYNLSHYRAITKDVIEWLDKLTKSSNHILGAQEGSKYEMHCTYCGHDYSIVEKPKLKQAFECPHCHEKFIFHRKKYAHTVESKYVYFTVIQKIGGVIYSRMFTGWKHIPYEQIDYTFVFKEIKRKRMDNDWTLRYSDCSSEHEKLIPEHPNRPRNGYYSRGDYDEQNGWLYPVGIKEMFENTEYKYSAIEFIAGHPVCIKPFEYLKQSLRYPMKERLAKMGYHNLAVEYWDNGHDKILKALMKLDKSKRDLFKDYDISFGDIECAITCECETLEEIEIACNHGLYYHYGLIRKFMSKNKLYAYLKSNKDCGMYKDYLVWCETLGENMTDKKILFPKNLKKAHDEKQKQLNAVKNKIIEDKIKKYAKELAKFEFENESLLIRPAMSQDELIDESRELEHCVRTYAERMASKETSIFFVRSKKHPQKPLVTVELKQGRIVQARAKNNQAPKKLVSNFIKQWERQFSLQGY